MTKQDTGAYLPAGSIFRAAELFSFTCGCGQSAVTNAGSFSKDGLEVAYRPHFSVSHSQSVPCCNWALNQKNTRRTYDKCKQPAKEGLLASDLKLLYHPEHSFINEIQP